MHVKDDIATKQNVTLWANLRSRRSRYKRMQLYIDQIYIRFQAPFGLRQKIYLQGKLFIFRTNCYFQGKFFPPTPVKCLPVRL